MLGVFIELPFRPDHYCFLPTFFRFYLNPKRAAKHRRTYRTRPELAVEILEMLCEQRKQLRFHVVADRADGGQCVLGSLPPNCDLTSRIVMKSRLYNAAPARTATTKGRPRVRGERQAQVA